MRSLYFHIAFALLVLIVLVTLTAIVRRWFKGADDKADRKRAKELKEYGLSLSHPENLYYDLADQIEVLIASRMDWDDDEAAVIALLSDQILNELDILKLIEAYGTRDDSAWGISGFFGEKTLPQLLRGELEPEDIETLNALYRSRGIQYQW